MSDDALEIGNKARLRVMAGRIIAQGRWPYISSVLFNLKLVEADIPTMAVDAGWRMYYSPTFVLSMEPEQLATVILHECMHCILAHAERYQALESSTANHEIWNICGDCAINDTLDEEKMPWPNIRGVRFADFPKIGIVKDGSTESNYFKMQKWADENPKSQQPGASGAPGSNGTNGTNGSPNSDCGSASGGTRRSYEIDSSDSDNPAVSRAQKDSTRDRVASDVLKASKSIGNVPGQLLRWAQEHLDPQVDWRSVLGSHMRRAVASVSGRRDYSYQRPSRRTYALRAMGSNIVLPAMRQPPPPRISVIVDTSGSISDDEIKHMIGEIVGIAKAIGISRGLDVIPCDAQVHEIQRIGSISRIGALRLKGGGGTDMRLGIEAALKLHPRPEVIITFTDGYTPWPDSPGLTTVTYIAALTEESKIDLVPTWMKKVLIKEI